MLAVSLDGRLAPPGGGAAQLGGTGDRRVLEEALAWADAALLGAQTLRLHGSTCLIHDPELLQERLSRGRTPQPVALVLSRTGRLAADLPFWRQPLQRWWLRPPASPPRLPVDFHRVLSFSSWPELRGELAGAGLRRLVLLGGADLAGQLLAADQVDELQLTLCPLLLGGPHSWLPPMPGLRPGRWQLIEHRSLGSDELLLRYRRSSAADRSRREPPKR
ncbi:MAG: dihydrofolate reductase family protein [Prochlorococcaceae cyanobacterium]